MSDIELPGTCCPGRETIVLTGFHPTHDISYAQSATTRGGKVVKRLVENSAGRLDLLRSAKGITANIADGRDFRPVMVRR